VEWKDRLRARVQRVSIVTRDVTLFCAGFALLRAWASFAEAPIRYPDTGTYMHVSFLGHGGNRLWTVPILFTALPSDSTRTFAQLLIGIVCWSALAFAVAYSLRDRFVARLGAVLILLLGLCIQVTEWDRILLSESLALSLTALLSASLLWVRLRPTRWALGAMLAVLTLWVFTKQLQAAVFVLVAVVAIVWILLRRRRFVAVAAALAVLAIWGGYATKTTSRGIIREAAHDLLVLRIFQSPENAAYFERRGMPQIAALKQEAATRTDLATLDPVYRNEEWQRWIDAHWQRTYAEWLLRHPLDDIRLPLRDVSNELSGFPNYASVRPALPGPVQDALWDRVPGGEVPMFLVLTLVLWLASLRVSAPGSLDALGGLLLASTAVWYFAGWHLGAAELQRVFVPVAASLRLSLLILALAAGDRIAIARAERVSRAGSRDVTPGTSAR
jgi:hypothetical protein